MSRTFAEDLARGIQRQNEIAPKLIRLMNREMVPTSVSTHEMDWVSPEDERVFAEFKGREDYTAEYIDKYCGGTVWIGKNKIDYLKKVGGVCDFFWGFKDSLWRMRYDETTANAIHRCKSRLHARNRADKANDKSVVMDIPFTMLTLVEKYQPQPMFVED